MATSILIHFDSLLNYLEDSLDELHTLLEEANALTDGLQLTDLHEAVHLPAYISALRRVLALAIKAEEYSMVRCIALQEELKRIGSVENSSTDTRG